MKINASAFPPSTPNKQRVSAFTIWFLFSFEAFINKEKSDFVEAFVCNFDDFANREITPKLLFDFQYDLN